MKGLEDEQQQGAHEAARNAGSDPGSKRRLYDWQLLPVEELERIAFNSHKQRKARLRDNPPRCALCPDARLTSLAMLATHQLSKRHRNRVNQQATCNLTLERPKHVIEDSHVSDTEKSTIVATEVPVSTSEEDKSAAENKTKATAKQRSRKAERDRKKARARLTKKVNPPVSATEEDVPMRDAIDDSNMRLLEIPEQMNNTCSPRDRALDDADSTTPKSGRELEEPDSRPVLSSTPNTTTEVRKSSSLIACSTADHQLEPELRSQPRTPWICSICGSRWKQEKGWQGHLLSAQHSRRVSRAIRSTIPAIPPYDRKDILDSMDPFGWGAGPGVVEADESENEDVDETSK